MNKPGLQALLKLGSLLAGVLASALSAAGLAGLADLFVRRARPGISRRAERLSPWQRAKLNGLSEAEAAARRSDQYLLERKALQKKRRGQVVRNAVFSVFNLTLVVLALSQLWLDDFWGAMGTLAVLAFNIALIIFQQEFAHRQVNLLLGQSGEVRASAIRDGRIRSLDLAEVVIGDLLVAGQGDEILAGGRLVSSQRVELNLPGAMRRSTIARPGDRLTPGSVVMKGDALYQVEQLPSLLTGQSAGQHADGKNLTPLERLLRRILLAMLFFAGVFYALLLVEVLQVDVLTDELMVFYRDSMATVFSLVPAGFFLMILVNYAMGSIDMARQGILVREIRKVEALAQLQTLFLVHTHALLNLHVNLEMLPGLAASGLDENLVRRFLGDLAHSASHRDVYLDVLAEEYPGDTHPLKEEAFFFSLLGWGGVVIDQPGMRGTFVLGYPQVLKHSLVKEQPHQPPEAKEKEKEKDTPQAGGWRSRLGGMFRRKKDDSQPSQDFRLRLKNGLQNLSTRIETIQGIPQAIQGSQTEMVELWLAYRPDQVSLYRPDGVLACPDGLFPLCRLSFNQQFPPAVKAILQRLQEEGVAFKLMTSLSREQVAPFLEPWTNLSAGFSPVSLLSADELELAGDARVVAADVFTDAGIQAMSQVIQAYRRSGLAVAAMANDYRTWEILRQANVSLAAKDSDQALTVQADIILQKKSLAPLNPLFERGQQLVHGTLDVIRLNLVELFYMLLILLAAFFVGQGTIPINASQGGMIAFFTVAIPAAVMSFWSPKGRVNQLNLGRELMRFVLPACLWIALAGLGLYVAYLNWGADLEYTRHVVTHALVCMGSLVALFARPPFGWLAGGAPVAQDRRPAWVVGLSFLVWNLLVWIPLAQKYLLIAPLNSLQDYALVWLVSLAAGGLIQVTWRIIRR
jgi:hypothetical protein